MTTLHNNIDFTQFFKSVFFSLIYFDIYFNGVAGLSRSDVDQHLEMGKKLLAAGQLADALSHYHAAVEGDPDNYMSYYRRATVYLALGKSKSALPDLDKVIELKPDFTAARTQRGNVLLKQGKLKEAHSDFMAVMMKDPQNEEAQRHLDSIPHIKEHLDTAMLLFERNDFMNAIDLLTKVIDTCPWDPIPREIRSECYESIGDYFKAASDIRATVKMRSDNTKGYLKLSMLHYDMGEADESLVQIRECLKLDPDHKECFAHYKKVKKLVKQLQSAHEHSSSERWDECVNKADQILKTEPHTHAYIIRAKSHKCHCFSQNGQASEAIDACNEVLDHEPENIYAICDKGEAYILNEQYDAAINEFQNAINIDNENRRANEGLKRAQKLLKQSKKRDYYKILNVKRNAKKSEILKAYRKLAVKWHPDKYEGEDKKRAEKNFIDIAAAKEVLTDPEKRKQFDNGEDPLDAEQQAQGGHGHPFFHQGFNPFGSGGGGGGFQFKFNFN